MNSNQRSRQHSVAVLFHVDDWRATTSEYVIAPGVSLNRFEGSAVEHLYHRLCDAGHDDGEPFLFRSFLRLDTSDERPYLLDYGDPYSLVDRFCNLVALRQQHPLAFVRIITSPDDFTTSAHTQILHSLVGQNDFLEKYDAALDDVALSDIAKAWKTVDQLWHRARAAGRISNALTCFYYSWRSHYLDQVCLHLVIALECLFAPHHAGESTHQIAFSVAQFVGGSPDERDRLFASVKQLYSLRSAIVHGGSADDDKLIDVVPKAFVLVARLLLRVLVEPGVAAEFGDEPKRRQLLKNLLFHG